MSRHLAVMAAKDNVVKTALRVISADHYERDGDPHADAEAEHAAELLALASRELTRSVDQLPEDEQPIGWHTEQGTTPQAHATVYQLRAGTPDDHDALHLGLYANPAAAKAHGVAEYQHRLGAIDALSWRQWVEDEPGVLRLHATDDSSDPTPTDWHIVPLTAAAEYDPDAEG